MSVLRSRVRVLGVWFRAEALGAGSGLGFWRLRVRVLADDSWALERLIHS